MLPQSPRYFFDIANSGADELRRYFFLPPTFICKCWNSHGGISMLHLSPLLPVLKFVFWKNVNAAMCTFCTWPSRRTVHCFAQIWQDESGRRWRLGHTEKRVGCSFWDACHNGYAAICETLLLNIWEKAWLSGFSAYEVLTPTSGNVFTSSPYCVVHLIGDNPLLTLK